MKRVVARVGIILSALLLGVAVTDASAQMMQSTDRVFAGVSFGVQTKARTFNGSGSLPLYDETATFDSSVGIGSERILDVHAGARVWSNLGLGAAFTRYTDTGTGTLNATIPDPLFFDTFHTHSASVEGLEHEQTQIHISAYWLQPVTDKFDISFFAGPTFFSVKQDLITGFTVPTGGTTIASVTTEALDESTVGFHAGTDFRYLFHQNVGAGVFLRYSTGSVDAASVDGGKIDVGGFQWGVGLRFRF